MHSLNVTLFRDINNLAGQSYYVDQAFIFITDYLIYGMMLFSVFYIWIIARKRMTQPFAQLHAIGQVFAVMFTSVVTWFTVWILKVAIALPRPGVVLPSIKLLINEGGNSFPSAHAAVSMAIATIMHAYYPNVGRYLMMLAVVIGVSRIYVGVHYPLDVAVGVLIGYGVARLFYRLFSRTITPLVK